MIGEGPVTEEDFLAFYEIGGLMTLADAASLTPEQVRLAHAARQKYDATQAVLLARAMKDEAAVLAIVDGGRAQRRNMVERTATVMRDAMDAAGRPVMWDEMRGRL